MFKFLKLNSNECYVSKKEELKKDIASIEKIIVVEGMLATQILKAQEFNTMSNFSKKMLVLFIATMPISFITPVTAIVHKTALVPIITLTGVEFLVLVAIIFLGISLIKAIDNNYNIEVLNKGSEVRVRLYSKTL
ncbi:hypothetical protein [Campylobacter ureolyticus]|uniref:Uncharacterized protein n=1 Tax=Campylobacter ureolyticus TaxID=827 RepID=A0A9Q4KNT2_9BACT|nr:hypothetical protein [Campylobacter ureolyticus]MCZ6160039.1 hypothetical protein [Campylobacter ureolyticus]MCZ6163762.1 hypothetical protein [Campylobacter ureolyticus]MCZ6165622.1 hypothetical protein [Campylobacter ureolyticus]MCZ6167296.1 hypothetical protein [Campylobacter ureolyticus]